MKIDINKVKKGTSEVPPECQAIIQKLKTCYHDNNNENLLQELQQTSSWTYGKCELFHWVDVLNIFDDILEHGARRLSPGLWSLAADTYNKKSRDLLLEVLRFTTLLIEHSFSRHLYNSMEHLLVLMGSSNLEILNGVLNLLYMFSKRSNFIPRLHQDSKSALLKYLMFLAESWGGRENGFGLASCCQEVLKPELRESATTLHFEYYDDTPNQKNKVTTIHIENIDKIDKPLASIMDELIETYNVPESQRMVLFTQLRLAHGFPDYQRRLLCVQARLQAISVLVYSNGLQDNTHQVVLYSGLLEELVELLELSAPELVDIRAAALRTLTSVIHLDRNPHFPKKPGSRLTTIIDVTGASNYHGQLPAMVRTCIASLTGSQPHEQARAYGASLQSFPLPLATALFSFLYHLASYEAGGEALVSCGMMESLLKVINWPGEDLDQITFVTRAVRVIDLITNIDMSAFQTHQGLTSFINRLELEVNICRKEQPFEIVIPGTSSEAMPDAEEVEPGVPPISTPEPPTSWRNSSQDENPYSGSRESDDMSEEPAQSASGESSGVRWSQPELTSSSSSQKSSEPNHDSDYTAQTPPSTSRDTGSDIAMEEGQEGQEGQETWVPKIIKIFSTPERNNSESAMEVDEERKEPAPTTSQTPEATPTEPQPGTSTAVTQFSTEFFERSPKIKESIDYSGNRWQDAKTGKTCLPQRAALIKSILNFLKKAIQDQAFSESMRTVMEGSLPSSLKHVISNSDYYGPSLFLLATDVVTVYIFQEPSLLFTLQDNYLTDVVLQALLVKEVPATREVLASLPNVISALCLNARGLAQFKQFHSFDHLCEIFVHPLYLPAMRRRRSNDPLGDTATTLGNAMDELMRHHPDLKTEAMKAVINLLDEIYVYGTSPQYVCESYTSKKSSSSPDPPPASSNDGGGSSDEEEDEDKEAPSTSYYVRAEASQGKPHTPIPLIDYIHNVMKFVDAILSNNSTEDHCKEFVSLGGLKYVVKLLSMPNLPADYAVTPAAQAVANVCKSILSLAREPKVLEEGLRELQQVLTRLDALTDHSSGKCVLLHELAMVPDLDNALYSYSATPLLHSMAATHGFVIMFVHVCRTGQSEMRNTSIFTWGSPLGLDVLDKLSKLYTSLVWESTLLLALCSDDVIPSDCDFGQQDLNLLLPQKEGRLIRTTTEAMNTMKVESPSSTDNCGEGTSFSTASKSRGTRVAPTPEQLKHLKLLLGAASRLGRALAELFGLLVKLCVGSPKRRVTFQNAFSYPTPGATEVARAMSDLLARGLNWNLVPPAPLEKFKLTYLICSVGFTSPMLFDDKKQPYHMIMHYFVEGEHDDSPSGLTAFFDSMYHALAGDGTTDTDSAGKKEFPEGTGEFLDAWLMLLEKMTNPKLILDSPNVFVQEHKIENTPVLEFCPYKYLVKIHRMAFSAIMEMWGRKPLKGYGFRMTDSMLCILKHILVGEKILQERLDEASSKQISLTTYGDHIRGGPAYGSRFSNSPLGNSLSFPATSTPRRIGGSESQVNETFINQLCDMGFSREAAIEALSQSRNIEMAITYLIENNRTTYQDPLDDLTLLEGMEPNLSEVLGTSSRDAPNTSTFQRDGSSSAMASNSTNLALPCTSSAADVRPRKKWRCEMALSEREAEMLNDIRKFQLSHDTMNKFTESALLQCLEVLENLPETVYRVCDLLMVICDRNGFVWCENMLESLCKDLSIQMVHMLKEVKDNYPMTITKLQEVLVDSLNARKVSVRLHLLTLLFDDLRFACVRALSHTCLVCFMIQLLEAYSQHSNLKEQSDSATPFPTPKWIAPLLLLLDLYEKTAVYTQRMHEMHKACTGVWKWFQSKTGKWTLYTAQNNKLINLAYWSGAPGCRVTVGENRRKYQINFNTLIQVNEDTSRGVPISMTLRRPDQEGLAAEMTGSSTEREKNKEYDSIYNQAHSRTQQPIDCISENDRVTIVEACVKLMQIPVDADSLHASLRLTLRLTRDYSLAKLFAEKGGITALLNLEQESNFVGFSSLATLIFRHVMEEPSTLRTAIERTIRARMSADYQPFHRELLFLMRNSEAGICRSPELYLEIAQKVLRVEYNASDDDRLILKYVRKTDRGFGEDAAIDKTAVSLIKTLLDQLVVPDEYLLKTCTEPTSTTEIPTTSKEPATTTSQNKFFGSDLEAFTSVLGNKKPAENKEKEKKETADEKKPKKLLSKSAILSILTDAVKSYMGYAKLIMDHVYEADPNNPVLTEDMSAVRFILEKFVLLPGMDKESIEICAEARLLLGAVGACNHSTAIQSALVVEVKNCIQRIVSAHYEDTKKKYTDVSCILALISEMMAMCPPTNWLSIVNNAVIKMKNNAAHLSNISKLFTRKGLINELARLPHNLDLSNPNFVFAMNAALKPLETLTKLANDRGSRGHAIEASSKANVKPNAGNRPAQDIDPTLTNSSGTTSGNTNAQGEETNEDAENTENDLSAAAESLEPASDSQVNDDITDIGEIVLEDQNMDRDTDRGGSMHMDEIVIPQDREQVESDDLSNPMTLQTALMQMTSEMVHGLITELQPNNQEQLTDPDDPDNLEEDQYGDEQMEEDNNEAEDGGYNNENDDPDDDFLIDTSIFNRPEHIMNDLFFVQYPSNDTETLGSFNELYSDDTSIRPEEPVVQPPIHHPLLVRRNREEPVPVRNPRIRPRRYQFLQLNPRSTSSHRPDLLQNLLFSRRHFRTMDYREGGGQENQSPGNHSFRNSNLVLMENGFGMLTRPDEENIDLLDQSMGYYFGQQFTPNVQSVCYVRWASEMKILDADSAAMAATVLTHKLRPTLEQVRDEEMKAKNANSSPAMDVSSPPSSTENNKNVEMAEVPRSTLETNAIDVLMHLPHRPNSDISESNQTESENSQEVTRLPEDSSSPPRDRRENDRGGDSNRDGEWRSSSNFQLTQPNDGSGDSNLRDTFAPYFMFDDDERVGPPFPIQNANEDIADEEDSADTRGTFELNTTSQDGDSDSPFLGWDSQPRSNDGLPLRRVPGSVRIAPALVPPAVYPLVSSPSLPTTPPLPEQPSEVPSAEQNDEMLTSAAESNRFNESVENVNNAEVPESDTDSTTPEPSSSRTSQILPDFLPSMFGQNTEASGRDTPTPPPPALPPPPFTASENTTQPDEESSSSNTQQAESNDAAENQSPVALDPEEMIQLYPNGSATYRGISIPAGLDPSFLAALPADMREEVFSNHLRQQSLQRSDLARESTTPPSSSITDEVNPEFLAALPLNIQEEVLAQQRQERQRQAAASANPNDPFDAAAFFQNLPSSLRQSILADIEESQISVLPPDLAAEAQNLRREHDARNRQYFQERERILTHNTLSSILRGTGPRGARVAIHAVPPIRSQWAVSSCRSNDNLGLEPSSETVGRQLLDQEAVSTLLVLLFVQDFRLNISRLHRVIRNLCCHPPTRDFVIRTLISIMEKCNESRSNSTAISPRQSSPKRKMPRSSFYPHSCPTSDSEIANTSTDPEPTWLNLSMDAALGCRANVFQVQLKRYGKRSLDNYVAHNVSIHPQAAPIVFRNAMDLLYTLTKVFQNEFLPKKCKDGEKSEDNNTTGNKKPINTAFWDILVRLENLNSGKSSKKGKSALKNQTSTPFNEVEPRSTTFDKSLMGHLITMLTCPLVKASTQLTDKLLHILNLASEGFTELDEEEAVPVTQEHLKIIVNVLTSNGCSENGLEQATNLLIRMSNCPDPTRQTSLKLLISGAQEVAALVKQHIEALLFELKEANARAKSDADLEVDSKENHRKGQIQDRFTKKSVVITAPSKVKGGFDIQLPAMQPLILKTSSQSFFLRILKVIIQLREVLVIRRKLEAEQRKAEKDKATAASTQNNQVPAGVTPDRVTPPRRRLVTASGVIEAVESSLASLYNSNEDNDDGGRSAASSMSVDVELVENNGAASEQSVVMEDTSEQTVIAANLNDSNLQAENANQSKTEGDVTMDTDPEKEPQEVKPEVVEEKESSSYRIPSLTKQLQLDDLWITLSECLTELEKTPDHHAALILQPAVEAFFLVHSTAINECRVLTNPANTSTPNPPRRGRNEGPPPLVPLYSGQLDFGVNDLLDRSQPASNVLVTSTGANAPSTSAQGAGQGAQQTSRTGQQQSFGHIIAEYRKFVQALGVANSGPLSVDVDAEKDSETNNPSTSQSPQPSTDLDAPNSLAAFFKQTENSPLLDPFKFLRFAELHRAVLNQILRQSTTHLADGPFAILVNFTRVLDFDVKRKYFRQELEKMDDGSRRGDETAVNVNRSHVFEESFRELHRKSPEEWKNKFYVVFESEEGQDAGGLLREWYMIISREIFNPDYALFTVSPGDRVTYTINPSSHCNPNHLLYFKFVGRLIAKAIYDSKYLECYFTRSFYKHILGVPVKYQDMESEDPEFYEGLVYLKKHKVSELGNDLTFTTDVQEFGVTESRELKKDGAITPVTDENKMEYIHLVCQMKMTGAIRKQLDAFLEGFYEIIPKQLISIFNEQELELLISGLPNIDIDDLKNNTEYNKYSRNSIQIVWFWRALREMDSQDQAKFLQFVTGTSKVPLQGFAALEGMNGIQKFQIHRDDRSTDRLPSAHTCFNQLDLPAYETYTKLKNNLLKAIHECSEGFGFA